jgi:hypothetical protein
MRAIRESPLRTASASKMRCAVPYDKTQKEQMFYIERFAAEGNGEDIANNFGENYKMLKFQHNIGL